MATSGFSRSRRLTHASEYDAVFKGAEFRVNSKDFLILARATGEAPARLGTVVSKRVAGTSVSRNRIRRVIKESFRHAGSVDGMDVVVVARPSVKDRNNSDLFAALDGAWKKLARERLN